MCAGCDYKDFLTQRQADAIENIKNAVEDRRR